MAARLERAVEVAGDVPVVALSGGTVHRPPPLDAHGFPVFESVASARYLRALGLPEERILFETASYDTVGNAYFARTALTDPLGLRRLVVVTSAFHLERVRAVFGWLFALPTSPGGGPAGPPYELRFEAAPDVGLDPDQLAARRDKERRSLREAAGPMARLHTLDAAARWVLTGHRAYRPERPEPDPGPATATY